MKIIRRGTPCTVWRSLYEEGNRLNAAGVAAVAVLDFREKAARCGIIMMRILRSEWEENERTEIRNIEKGRSPQQIAAQYGRNIDFLVSVQSPLCHFERSEKSVPFLQEKYGFLGRKLPRNDSD